MQVPSNVINKKLYLKIKKEIKDDHVKKGKRWGLYSSSELVRKYKKVGGKYKTQKNIKTQGTLRWYQEMWIDTCQLPKIVKCGRDKFSSNKSSFPYCRPLHKISKTTPKTVSELTSKQIQRQCQKKKRSPQNIIYLKPKK